MRPVIFFHPCNDYTGSTRVLSNVIAEKYDKEEVTVVTERNNNKGFLSECSNVRIINVFNPKYKGKGILFLSSLIWRFHSLFLALVYGWRYETFYINTIIPYYAALVGRLYGKSIIWHVHEKFVERPMSIRFAESVFNRTTAHRIFVSQYLKGQYPENASCSYEVKYNKLSQSYIDNVVKVDLKERSLNRILMLSSLSLHKGVDMFLRLASCMPEYDFVLIVSCNAKRIDDFFSQMTIPSNCKVLPAQSDIHPFLRKTDLILNLSNPLMCVETFGMTILEAMPYGIPAIVPNVGGPKEIVQNGVNGYCVDVRDLEMLSNYVRLSLNKENYRILSNNALALFEEKFK